MVHAPTFHAYALQKLDYPGFQGTAMQEAVRVTGHNRTLAWKADETSDRAVTASDVWSSGHDSMGILE